MAGTQPDAPDQRGAPPREDTPGRTRARRFDLDRPLLPESTSDDTDAGWAERPVDNEAQLLADRPPHWA